LIGVEKPDNCIPTTNKTDNKMYGDEIKRQQTEAKRNGGDIMMIGAKQGDGDDCGAKQRRLKALNKLTQGRQNR
jgi:hypothetical protein